MKYAEYLFTAIDQWKVENLFSYGIKYFMHKYSCNCSHHHRSSRGADHLGGGGHRTFLHAAKKDSNNRAMNRLVELHPVLKSNVNQSFSS